MKLTEKQIEQKFRSSAKSCIAVLGKKATTNIQLDQYGKKYIKNYIGTFSQDSIIPKHKDKPCSFIINTDTKGKPGTHWVAVHKSKTNNYYIYDSFGRTSKKLIPIFVKNKIYIDSDYDAEQAKDSEICGCLCMAWLICIDLYGIRSSLKI